MRRASIKDSKKYVVSLEVLKRAKKGNKSMRTFLYMN